MTIQAVLMGVIAPVLYGALFHLWRGGATWRLGLYILLAEIGFWIAHVLGTQLGWEFIKVGSLQMGAGTLAAFAAVFLGYWLSSKRPETPAPRPKNTAARSVKK
jgi:uncharacterized membrane protein YfcA